MQCPQCGNELPAGARFCGICGRGVGEGTAVGGRRKSMSLFELPPARGPRLFRIAMILLLDVILAGSGIAMVMSYLSSREGARAAVTDHPLEQETESLAPAGDAGAGGS